MSTTPEVDQTKISMLEKMVDYCQECIEILKAVYNYVPAEYKPSTPV